MTTGHRRIIERVFTELEQRGVLARPDFWCCGNCAGHAMYSRERDNWTGQEPPIGYVFFHEQDTDYANEGGPLYLGFGSFAEDRERRVEVGEQVGELICEVLRENHLGFKWDGNLMTRIQVTAPHGVWELDYDRDESGDYDEDEES